ncbi:MAG: hydrogenase maturation nickel metallochaperone HypA [Chloroflexota bacterium]|nr:hydrogenase maturation nickel metallochaperone HypA [Chloroflexota bacterium]MBI5703649.1 hydrogenase maturation nickel metallochaperone HypA [Chloroflexota bacterium]
MLKRETIKTLFDAILQQTHGKRVRQIVIAVGEIAEIRPAEAQALWQELAANTPLERAQLQFRLIPAEVQCMACFKKYRPASGEIRCPNCGSFGAKILSGEEFHVEHIETEE